MVDLGAGGARTSNFVRSESFDGRSSVEAALLELSEEQIRVCGEVRWA
ncbi:MAG: hypothetical protein JRI23_01995 [Deltaproteobacteria bacterium]|nr:hypothetical protein [Deltaproteobacteria bacterium]MBW2530247.1 hypothetical protein [Deltaproteobacteria bacterium]